MTCTACGGDGCEACGGSGWVVIEACPREAVPGEIWETVHMAELYLDRGLPPVAGGQLDQARGFVRACERVERTRRACGWRE